MCLLVVVVVVGYVWMQCGGRHASAPRERHSDGAGARGLAVLIWSISAVSIRPPAVFWPRSGCASRPAMRAANTHYPRIPALPQRSLALPPTHGVTSKSRRPDRCADSYRANPVVPGLRRPPGSWPVGHLLEAAPRRRLPQTTWPIWHADSRGPSKAPSPGM